jgi:hypothetical protein
MADIALKDLTESKVDGTGVFDALMRATKAQLDEQFKSGAIRGPEYATVYLGSLESAMQTALSFITARERINLEAQLLEQQVQVAKIAVIKANAEVELMQQQVLNAKQEVELSKQKIIQIQEEIKLLPKQGQKLDAEIIHLNKQNELVDIQKQMTNQQVLNLAADALNIPKQGVVLEKQALQIVQQTENATIEKTVLVAQECKLRAEFDFTAQNTLKAAGELTLLNQKTATERAQILALGVDQDSVVGRQKALYLAQTSGFKRDAEQKAAGLYIDVWKTLRMTDNEFQANATQKLDDANIGAIMTKLISGLNAA